MRTWLSWTPLPTLTGCNPWWNVTYEMWSRWYGIAPSTCPWLMARSVCGVLRGALVLSRVNCGQGCPGLSLGLTFVTRQDPINRIHITYSLLRTAKAVRVLWVINPGNLPSYWPWNIFLYWKQFLKKGSKKPFLGRLKKISTFLLSLGQASALPSSLSAADQNSSIPASSRPKTHFL